MIINLRLELYFLKPRSMWSDLHVMLKVKRLLLFVLKVVLRRVLTYDPADPWSQGRAGPDGLLKTHAGERIPWFQTLNHAHKVRLSHGSFLLWNISKSVCLKPAPTHITRATSTYFLGRVPILSLIIIAQIVSWVNLVSSLVSVKMPADAPRVTERKQNATVRRGWGGFSQLSASIQSAQKTSKERIELLLCVCHTVIPDRRPLRSSATFPPHIRTRWRRFIQIPRSDPNDLMWRDNDVRMTNVKRKMTTKGIASVFSWPLQKILLFYIIISNLKVKSWSKKKKEINSIIINLPFWNLITVITANHHCWHFQLHFWWVMMWLIPNVTL